LDMLEVVGEEKWSRWHDPAVRRWKGGGLVFASGSAALDSVPTLFASDAWSFQGFFVFPEPQKRVAEGPFRFEGIVLGSISLPAN